MKIEITPREFVAKWQDTQINEEQSAQSHFIDLCHLLNYDTLGGNTAVDRFGNEFVFEKRTASGGKADVYLENHFIMEYKAPGGHKDLDAAFDQINDYRIDLKNPPLLIVSDIDRWRIHTNFESTKPHTYEFTHEEILKEDIRRILWNAFFAPRKLHPDQNRERVTEDAAKSFKAIVDNMRQADLAASPVSTDQVAHFLTKLVFCLFAEDVTLLPTMETGQGIFSYIVRSYAVDLESAKITA